MTNRISGPCCAATSRRMGSRSSRPQTARPRCKRCMPGKPDLVLLHVMLPGIDGLEVTAEPGNSQPDHARGCASRGRGLAVLGGRADCPSSIPASIADYARRALVHLYMDVHNI